MAVFMLITSSNFVGCSIGRLSRRRASKDTVDICDGPAPEGGQTADTYGHVQPERHEVAVEGLDRYAVPRLMKA